jgi:DNA-binding GntR family transcriptional regulator
MAPITPETGGKAIKSVDRSPTLAEAAANSIRDAIFRGDLSPGTPLREVELSQTLHISRGTVREALRLLTRQGGLVETIPYKGTIVAVLTPERVKEIYTLRAQLESYAVRLALENNAWRQEEVEQCGRLVAQMSKLLKEENYFDEIHADMEFHRRISAPSNHHLLLEVLNNLQSQILALIVNTKLYRSDRVPDDISHQAILDAIVQGDPVAAEEIVRNHIIDAGSALLQRMLEIEAQADKRGNTR